MAKLLLILMALGALLEGLASQAEPPLLIDASQPSAPSLDADL
jgi:hypothetical protein